MNVFKRELHPWEDACNALKTIITAYERAEDVAPENRMVQAYQPPTQASVANYCVAVRDVLIRGDASPDELVMEDGDPVDLCRVVFAPQKGVPQEFVGDRDVVDIDPKWIPDDIVR